MCTWNELNNFDFLDTQLKGSLPVTVVVHSSSGLEFCVDLYVQERYENLNVVLSTSTENVFVSQGIVIPEDVTVFPQRLPLKITLKEASSFTIIVTDEKQVLGSYYNAH